MKIQSLFEQMLIEINAKKPYKTSRNDCIVVGVYTGNQLLESGSELNQSLQGGIISLLKTNKAFKCSPGELLLWHLPNFSPSKSILLVGLGKQKQISISNFVKIQTAVASEITTRQWTKTLNASIDVPVKGKNIDWNLRTSARIQRISTYHFQLPNADSKDFNATQTVAFSFSKHSEQNYKLTVEQAQKMTSIGDAIGKGSVLSKYLADLPANICTPTYLASISESMGDHFDNLSVKIYHRPELEQMGMNALLSVSTGSAQPPVMIEIKYQPEQTVKGIQPIGLVGKGVTFDTGGISLKPSASMDEMKYDMSGAASVLGTVYAAAELALDRPLIALVPATENMPAHNATKPGDVVTSASGQTIEVLNTDAEGRLILCDALHHMQQFDPEVIIDVATLTGACVVALGAHFSGVMSNDDRLANDLMSSGYSSHDRCWRLPLDDDYDQQLKSNFADIANIGSGRGAGTITAGCFLQRFVKPSTPWAHLDIAGTAWITGQNKGSTGRPVGLLSEYLIRKNLLDHLIGEETPPKSRNVPIRGVIGPIIENGLRAALSSKEIIRQVHLKVPNAKTNPSTIAYYAHRLRKNGEVLPSRPRTRVN